MYILVEPPADRGKGKGVVVIKPRSTEYHGLITGIPMRTGPRPVQKEELAPEPRAGR